MQQHLLQAPGRAGDVAGAEAVVRPRAGAGAGAEALAVAVDSAKRRHVCCAVTHRWPDLTACLCLQLLVHTVQAFLRQHPLTRLCVSHPLSAVSISTSQGAVVCIQLANCCTCILSTPSFAGIIQYVYGTINPPLGFLRCLFLWVLIPDFAPYDMPGWVAPSYHPSGGKIVRSAHACHDLSWHVDLRPSVSSRLARVHA